MFIGAFNVWVLNVISIGECRLTHLIQFVYKIYVGILKALKVLLLRYTQLSTTDESAGFLVFM